MKKDKSKERTAAYRERLSEKKASAAEHAYDREQCAKFDLRFFGESAHNHNAESASAEIHIHRQMLRALDQVDVQEGERVQGVYALPGQTYTYTYRKRLPKPFSSAPTGIFCRSSWMVVSALMER